MANEPDTIVLIHGLWMTPRSWEHWKAHYEGQGYTVLAPAWPGMEGEVEELNRDPSPIAKLDVDQIVDHYERYHVPGSTTVLREGAFANLHRDAPTKVDFAKADRAPLLFIAFGEDHIVPAKASERNAEKYTETGSPAIVEFREFAGRPHFPGVPGWEEVADYALAWVKANVGAGVPAGQGAS
jgi:alpha-beta hydrolase superfamily lysophospholipase